MKSNIYSESKKEESKCLPSVAWTGIFADLPLNFFDGLKAAKFRDLLNELLTRIDGPDFQPGIPDGKDGGIDGEIDIHLENKTRRVYQYKWHEIGRVGNKALQKVIIGEYRDCINKKLVKKGLQDGTIREIVFITNVQLVRTQREESKEFEKESGINLKIWDFSSLKSKLQSASEPSLLLRYFPHATESRLQEIERKLLNSKTGKAKKIKTINLSSEIKKTREFLVDKKLRKNFYHALVYFLGPILLEGSEMINIRKLLGLDKNAEKNILKTLKRERKVVFDKTRKLIYIKNRELAIINAQMIFEKLPLTIEELSKIKAE